MTSSDIHSLSGAYALDSVDDLERAAFERHLRECDPCSTEVRELRETVGRLADSVAVEPPPSLRASVLDAVARTPQAPPGRPGRPASGGNVAAVRRWRRFAAVSVAASVLVAGVGVGTWTVADRNVDDARRVATAAQERAAAIERVMSAPDVRVFAVGGLSGGGRVNVAVSRSVNQAVAVLNGLPDPGADRVYQLWMIPAAGASAAVSPGPLAPRQTGGSQVLDIGDAVAFGVSVEPVGGSPRPTDVIGTVQIIE